MPLQIEPMGPFETYPVEFRRDGNVYDEAQVQALLNRLRAGASDLLVLSHGWNNDSDEATGLYRRLLTKFAGPPAERNLVVMRVYWPSKRFADSELIPAGGAASLAGETVDQTIAAQIECLQAAYPDDGSPATDVPEVLEQLRGLIPRLEADETAQEDFARLLRSVLPPGLGDEEELLQDNFYTLGGSDLLQKLSRPFNPEPLAEGGAMALGGEDPLLTAGGAAGLGNLFQGIKNGAFNLLNLFTYYEMKERAGTVGGGGVSDVLRRAQLAVPALRVHLCGHSFGGRLVTAALAAQPAAAPEAAVRSLVLLQAAFSHWGFASRYDGKKDGLFRRALDAARLGGPVLVTHTTNDRAVGLAYPLASRLRGAVAAALGDANDPYGGIGRNGAQKTPEVEASEARLRAVGSPYGQLRPGRVYNLESSAFITSHGAVDGAEVAQALLAAIEAVP